MTAVHAIVALVALAAGLGLGLTLGRSRPGGTPADLHRLTDLVHTLHRESAAQSGATHQALAQVTRAQESLARYTADLRTALASPKARGQWGERMADDVLRAAGFVEGVNYRRQTAVDGGSIPDITFLLPHDLEVRMDVKFPVDNHLRSLDAGTPAEAAACRKAFVRDVRARVRELSGRRYRDARDTVDCVLLFIPNESVYAALHEADPEVLDVALAEGVVLCSPSTLFAVLAVIRHSVEQFRLQQVSDEILRCLGGVEDQWYRFVEQLELVERRLASLNTGFDDLQGVRRRQIERTFGEIDRLRTGEVELDVTDRESGIGEATNRPVRSVPLADSG